MRYTISQRITLTTHKVFHLGFLIFFNNNDKNTTIKEKNNNNKTEYEIQSF